MFGSKDGSTSPSIMQKAGMSMLKSFITPDMVEGIIAEMIKGIQGAQQDSGKRFVLTAELLPDGKPDINLWERGEGSDLVMVKEIDLSNIGQLITAIKS